MPNQHQKLKRRAFVEMALAAAAGGTAVSCAPGGRNATWRFFTADEAEMVDAICEQIVPADRDPGAREARVVNYIDTQLTRRFKKYQQTYRKGIAAVDAASRTKFGKPFVKLPAEQQTEVLVEAEEKSEAFFSLILNHTRQGFYGDPRHGGNRDRVSWKMVGLTFPQVRGREHYTG